jgi:predicted lipid carrier protein YhbT
MFPGMETMSGADGATETPTAEALEAELRRIADSVRERPFDERYRLVKGRYLFDVIGLGAWIFRADHGAVSFGKEEAGQANPGADCVLHCGPEEFLRIAQGLQNPLTAAMQGRIAIEGDMALGQKLTGFGGPP